MVALQVLPLTKKYIFGYPMLGHRIVNLIGDFMTAYETYVFILCLIVFLLFTLLFSFVITTMMKQKLKLIKHGLEDKEIKKEKDKKAKTSKVTTIFVDVVSLLVCVALFASFVFSLYLNFTKDKAPNGIPSLKVVKTSSMATKNKNNTYLFKNDLNDQIQTFDLIVTHHLPKEEDLKLYDIVVYKRDDTFVIHRIIGIEEPNDKHPDRRHFLLQGDSVLNPDQFPVLYSQMQGIYKGQRIPFIGSFILFMQSPAGWLCILLILFAAIVTPILERKLENEANARLAKIESESHPANDFDISSSSQKAVALTRGGQDD